MMAKKTALKKLKYGDEFKIKNWKCTIDKGVAKGDLISCISNKGTLVSIFSDETIRFSKDNKELIEKHFEDLNTCLLNSGFFKFSKICTPTI